MFVTRTISSIILVVIALVTIFSGGLVLALTLYLVSCIAFFELAKAMGVHSEDKKINILEMVGIMGITGYYAVIYFHKTDTLVMMILLFTLVAFMFAYVFTFPRYHVNQVVAAFFAIIYAPVMLSFIFLTRSLSYGIALVWMIFISSWVCDTSAYLVGITIGKHKMAPQLSPKKSIEGAIGGVVGSAIVGALFGYLVVEKMIATQEITLIFALIGAIGAVISQIGDLAASAIKRNHTIKDYGKLIPGHGGIMDRFDSVIFTAPMIYFLMAFFIR